VQRLRRNRELWSFSQGALRDPGLTGVTPSAYAVWTPGIDNYRVQYTAGYTQIPNDVQEACAEWVTALFWQTKSNPVVYPATPPAHVALILNHYRQSHPMPM
jgi:hypothetical protein